MATETKEKLIRVLQLMQTTDEKTPMNATQIVEKLSTEYELEGVNRKAYTEILHFFRIVDMTLYRLRINEVVGI